MQEPVSLNDLYEDYALGIIKKDAFESAVLTALREEPPSIYLPNWSKEDYEDYSQWLYPRISRCIDVYQPAGSSFDIYIRTVARMAAREFHALNLQSYVEETAAWLAQVPDMYVHEKEFPYGEPLLEEEETQEKKRNPRQLLILLLKCSTRVSVDFIGKAASKLGMKPEELNSLTAKLREQQYYRERKLRKLQESANNLFARCLFYEKRQGYLEEGSGSALRIQKKLEKGREKLTKMRRRILQMNCDPPNRQIAEILGIKKSTVDSTLYALKKRSAHQSSKKKEIAEEENPSPLSE